MLRIIEQKIKEEAEVEVSLYNNQNKINKKKRYIVLQVKVKILVKKIKAIIKKEKSNITK